MKKFLHFDWLRAVQFFSKTVQKRVNSVQKEETNQAFWLVNDQRNLQMANQIFCFQIKRTPSMAQFFPDCVIHVRFFCFTISKFRVLLISNHMIFLVQFGISTCKFFKDPKLHSAYRLVQFCQSLKNLLVLIYSKLHSKSCDYLYKTSYKMNRTRTILTTWGTFLMILQ